MSEVLPAPPPQLDGVQNAVGGYRTTEFSGTEGIYLLPHHQKEIDRLRKQHKFMNSTTGGFLLVTPNLHGTGPLRVLDAGAADGEEISTLRYLARQSHK